jgi:hypothetical protein
LRGAAQHERDPAERRALVHFSYPHRASRWAGFLALVLCLLVGLASQTTRAEEGVLPVAIQVELLVKVASYDRNFLQRAKDRAKVVIVTKPGNGDSGRVAAQIAAALARAPNIAGLPHEETIVPYGGAPELATLCKTQGVAILFLGPGFREDVEAIRAALDKVDVLTATSIPDYVPAGIVLGFDVAAGRPQLLVNLGQARRQNVALRADVLKLMKVFE